MNYLADVNVWVALAVIGHTHHNAARAWFETSSSSQVAFCRVTQQRFLRLLTNSRVMGENVLTARDAWQLYDELFADSRVSFWGEPAGLEPAWRIASGRLPPGTNSWTDAYLSAFANTTGCSLVTFDGELAQSHGIKALLLK